MVSPISPRKGTIFSRLRSKGAAFGLAALLGLPFLGSRSHGAVPPRRLAAQQANSVVASAKKPVSKVVLAPSALVLTNRAKIVGEATARKKAAVRATNAPSIAALSAATSIRFPTNPVSPAFINRELMSAASPMAGLGEKIVGFGKKYNIDPAFFLAVAVQESKAGTAGRAVYAHNPTNIRWTPKSGYSNTNGFNLYPSWEAGAEAFFRNIANGSNYYKKGRFTVGEVINVWAPPVENNTSAYVSQVLARMARYRGAVQ